MPDLAFEVLGGAAERYAAVPTLGLQLRIEEKTGVRVQAIALRVQIRIEPQRRRYGPEEEERLYELFGETRQWGESLRPFLWTQVATTVGSFSGSTEVSLHVPCTYDFEVAGAKYLHGLESGEIPLLLLFNGTVFRGGPGRNAGGADTVAPGGQLPVAGPGLAGGAGPVLPRQRLAAAPAGHPRRPSALQDRASAPDVGTSFRVVVESRRRRGQVTATPVTSPGEGRFATARKVADAVIYEGYVLYPYRASAQKNQVRWQFGVLAPRPFSEATGSEPWAMQTECVLEAPGAAAVSVQVRFLRVLARVVEEAPGTEGDAFTPVASLEVDGELWTTWEESSEQQIDLGPVALGSLVHAATSAANETAITLEGRVERELLRDASGRTAGRVVRELRPVCGRIGVSAERGRTGRRPHEAAHSRGESHALGRSSRCEAGRGRTELPRRRPCPGGGGRRKVHLDARSPRALPGCRRRLPQRSAASPS